MFELHVPEQAPQAPHVVHAPSSEINIMWYGTTENMVQTDSINSHSQGPVFVGVAMHGLLPLKSIERCLISALQVPAHAPQLPQTVHAPSTSKEYMW